MFPLYNKKICVCIDFFLANKRACYEDPVKYKSDWKMSAYKLLFKYAMYYQ